GPHALPSHSGAPAATRPHFTATSCVWGGARPRISVIFHHEETWCITCGNDGYPQIRDLAENDGNPRSRPAYFISMRSSLILSPNGGTRTGSSSHVPFFRVDL